MATVRYALDPRNRLVISRQGARGGPFRVVRTLDGSWRLTETHDLELTIRDTSTAQPQTLSFRGTLAQAKAHALTVAVRQVEGEPGPTGSVVGGSQQVTLSGRWAADEHNRLTFLVAKSDGSEDRLTLQGGWEVGPHHELRYRYQERDPARHDTVTVQTLAFQGAWDVARAGRLVYRLEGSATSAFEFTAGLQSPSLHAKAGRIVYHVGVGVAGGGRRRQRVVLFGTWKLHRDLSVSFEVPYAGGRVQAIRFEGEVGLSRRDRVALALRAASGELLGLTVTFTRKLVGDAEWFARLRKQDEELEALGGVHVRF